VLAAARCALLVTLCGVFLVLFSLGGNGDEFRQPTISNTAICEVSETDWTRIQCPERITVFQNDFYRNPCVGVHRGIESLLRDGSRVEYRTPKCLSRYDIWVNSAPSSACSNKFSSKQAHVLKQSDVECSGLAVIPYAIIPHQRRLLRIIFNPVGVRVSQGSVVHSEDRSFVQTKVSLVGRNLFSHSGELSPKNASGDGGENCGDHCAYASNHGPSSYASGCWIHALLFVSAFVCGISAGYVDQKWPKTGWIPLAIFVVIAAICAAQLWVLSNQL
jgi:hypothetical protein